MLKRIKDDLGVGVRVITVESLIWWIEFIKRIHIALGGCLRSLQTNRPLQRSLTNHNFNRGAVNHCFKLVGDVLHVHGALGSEAFDVTSCKQQVSRGK